MNKKFIAFFIIIFVSVIFSIVFITAKPAPAKGDNSYVASQKLPSEENNAEVQDKEKAVQKKLGVKRECFDIARIVYVEGVYEGEVNPKCSQLEVDRILDYCAEHEDECFE